LEEEGHFCHDLGEVVDDHAGEEGLAGRGVSFSALQEDFILERGAEVMATLRG
jgi:hypothetical protein